MSHRLCRGRVPSEALCPYSAIIVQFWLLLWDSHPGEKTGLFSGHFYQVQDDRGLCGPWVQREIQLG